jgi:hypothetical protein
MGRPTNAEIAARMAAASADETHIEGDEGPEEFEQPVPVVKADTPTPDWRTKVRVLPSGDGKIATGHYDRESNAFTYHKKGDFLHLPPALAKEQEDRGLVEIVSGD